jgi:hypothetical protein
MGVSAGPKFDMGVRQNWTYLLGENMKIVSKRISELPFFFDLCVRKNFWERTNKFECSFFGWVSLTRLKFNTSFFWSYKTVIGFLIWLVMSQVTDSMCKYAHNSYFNNWSGDNASNKITCSLWDTLCILESLFVGLLGFLWTKSKSRVRAFFWLSVGRKLSLFSEKKKG